MPPQQQNGWQQWSNHVLKELDRLNSGMLTMNNELTQLRIEIAMLKVKSGIWGAIGACVPIAIAIAVQYLRTVS